MVLEKRGKPRNNRRTRLPSASYTGTTRFTPAAEEWKRIERPFGLRFSDEDRRELVDIVEAYFKSEPFERAAPFAHDAQAWLADVRTKADAFWRSLQPPALHSRDTPGASSFVDSIASARSDLCE